MMNIGANMQSARQLVEQVENTGGAVPPVLCHIVAGYALLNDQPAQLDPTKRIVEAAADGTLTAEKLTTLCAEATRAQAAAEYQSALRQRAENLFTERFYRALCDGAGDQLLDSLRPQFDQAATQLADALTVVDINAPAEYFASTAGPEEIEARRSIRPAVRTLEDIAAIARRFGPRSVDWAVLDLPSIIDHRDLVDEAIMCTSSDLVQAGTVFRARLADLKTVPWLRITPRLNSIAEAKERLRKWSSDSWEALNQAGGRGHFDENGEFVAEVRRNPFAAKVQP